MLYTLNTNIPFVRDFLCQNKKNAYFVIHPGLEQGDQAILTSARSKDSQKVHPLLVKQLPLLSDSASDPNPHDSIILADRDWKAVANLKSLLYYGRLVKYIFESY